MSIKTKSRLGRGLSSLISVSEEPAAPAKPDSTIPTPVMRELPKPPPESSEAKPAPLDRPAVVSTTDQTPQPKQGDDRTGLLEIAIEQIVPNPYQPRRQMNDASIAELAASLRSTGLIQPIVLRKVGGQYQLIAGERRWRAAKLAGLASIPAIIRETSSLEQAQMALVENIQRENLNAIDRAMAYKTLMTQLGLTQAELAGRIGEDRSSVANYLRLLDLAPEIQAMVADERLSLGHAKILAGVSDRDDQIRLATLVVNQSLSVRNLERQIQAGPAQSDKAPAGPSAHYMDMERTLSQQLGMRVQVVKGQKNKGRVVLHYATLDQFDDVIRRLGGRLEE